MPGDEKGLAGYKGRWACVDLSTRAVSITRADPAIYSDYIGGRGVQARLLYDHIKKAGPLKNPLGPDNRIIIGNAAPNDTFIPTAGRGSCSFISPMTRSSGPAPWIPGHKPVFGLMTHSSCGGLFPNMLKRAGFDHLIIDGRADTPVRILVADGDVQVIDAEDYLFESVEGRKTLRTTSAVTDALTRKYPGSSTVCTGPAGWYLVDYACLTADHHRNFGRGGAGAVFGSKNLVAVTAFGREPVASHDPDRYRSLVQEIDAQVKGDVDNSAKTVSFRPMTGTTWWLDRAFHGGYLGTQGGYLPWHNFDEGTFSPADYLRVSTAAFLEISGLHRVCNRCRHIMCTRAAHVDEPPYAGSGVRPEFETIALWINCCLVERNAFFHLNYLCNELGVDTMTFGSVMAAAMELSEYGYLDQYEFAPVFGNAQDMVRTLSSVAYQSSELGKLLSRHADRIISQISASFPSSDLEAIARPFTAAFGGLGYAGVQPKAFPGMFAAYATSNRGRGDHTYAWTIQAEEAGLTGAENLAAYIIQSQTGKALVDSLGLCDFFTVDITSDLFLGFYHALTGLEYSAESLKDCGRRIYALERRINNIQGRDRTYDAFVPPKLTVPMSRGAHVGKRVDPAAHGAILDAYYRKQGWTADGIVGPEPLQKLGIE